MGVVRGGCGVLHPGIQGKEPRGDRNGRERSGRVAPAVPTRLCSCWSAENRKEPGRSGSAWAELRAQGAEWPDGPKPAPPVLPPPSSPKRPQGPLAVHVQLVHKCSSVTFQFAVWSFLSYGGCGSTLSPSSPLLSCEGCTGGSPRWEPT